MHTKVNEEKITFNGITINFVIIGISIKISESGLIRDFTSKLTCIGLNDLHNLIYFQHHMLLNRNH